MRYGIDANVKIHVLGDSEVLTEKQKTAVEALYDLAVQKILEKALNSEECLVKIEVDSKVVEEE